MNIPDGVEAKDIPAIRGKVTNVDPADSRDDFAETLIGYRLNTSGLMEMDYGTKHACPSYPVTKIADHTAVKHRGMDFIVDPTLKIAHKVLFGLDYNDVSRLYVNESTNGTPNWTELTRKISVSALYDTPVYGGVGFENYTRIRMTLASMTEDGVAVTALSANEMQGYMMVNTSTAEPYTIARVISSGVSGGTYIELYVLGDMVTTCEWAQANTYEIYRSNVRFLHWENDNGDRPILSMRRIEAIKKLSLLYTHEDGTTRIPVQVNKCDATNLYWVNGTPVAGMAANKFQLSTLGLCAGFAELGSQADPQNDLDGTQYVSIDSAGSTQYPWLKIGMRIEDTTAIYRESKLLMYLFGYITVVYRNRQESDPILRYCASIRPQDPVTVNVSPTSHFDFFINPALIDDDVTGFRIWGAPYTYTEYSDNNPLSIEANAVLAREIFLTKVTDDVTPTIVSSQGDKVIKMSTSITVAQKTWRQYVDIDLPLYGSQKIDLGFQAVERGIAITDVLNHGLDLNREYHKPRFVAAISRAQQSILATDDGDRKLRFSIVDGYGIHQEDNFPDVSQDLQGNPLFAELLGRGRIMGLVPSGKYLLILRENETERYDTDSGRPEILEPDCVSTRSIVNFPKGTAWVGTAGIWFAPSSGADPYLLNVDIQNEHDGRLKLTNGTTPVITEEARQNVVGGYDPIFNDLWFQYEQNLEDGTTAYVIKRIFMSHQSEESGHWTERKIGGNPEVLQMLASYENKLHILTENSILEYPNTEGTYNYLDGVQIDNDGDEVAETGTGFDMTAALRLGSIANPVSGTILHGLRVNHKGRSTSRRGKFQIDVIRDDRKTSDVSQSQRIDQPPNYIADFPVGSVKLFKVQLSIPSHTIGDVERLQVSSITYLVKKSEAIHA